MVWFYISDLVQLLKMIVLKNNKFDHTFDFHYNLLKPRAICCYIIYLYLLYIINKKRKTGYHISSTFSLFYSSCTYIGHLSAYHPQPGKKAWKRYRRERRFDYSYVCYVWFHSFQLCVTLSPLNLPIEASGHGILTNTGISLPFPLWPESGCHALWLPFREAQEALLWLPNSGLAENKTLFIHPIYRPNFVLHEADCLWYLIYK